MLKRNAINFLLSFLCYVALGIVLIVWPSESIKLFCYVLGSVTAAYGLWQGYRFITHREEKFSIVVLLVGIIALALGICLFVNPELFGSILPFILGLYLIFDGIVKLQAALNIKKEGYKRWAILLLLSLLMIALGVVILINPFRSGAFLITFIGICMLVDGVINLWNAIVVIRHLRVQKKADIAIPEDVSGTAEPEDITAEAVDMSANVPAEAIDTAEEAVPKETT